MDFKERFRLLKIRLADVWKFPRCFIVGHKFADQNYCARCDSVFCAGAWSGFELREKLQKLKQKRNKPPFELKGAKIMRHKILEIKNTRNNEIKTAMPSL